MEKAEIEADYNDSAEIVNFIEYYYQIKKVLYDNEIFIGLPEFIDWESSSKMSKFQLFIKALRNIYQQPLLNEFLSKKDEIRNTVLLYLRTPELMTDQ